MFDQIIKYIKKGRYEEASILFDKLKLKDKEELVLSIYDNKSFAFYGFYKYMYNKTKEIDFLKTLEVVMSFYLCWFDGAGNEGFRIIKKLLELERSEENLTKILDYFGTPTLILTDDEAKLIAKEILTLNPHNKRALEVLEY